MEATIEPAPSVSGRPTTEPFEAFYRREWAPAVRFGWALTGSRAGAEDLAQDAFVAANRKWSAVGTYDRPDAWIRRAMTNRSANRTRQLLREARAKLRLGSHRQPVVVLDDAHDEVWEAVRSLSPQQMLAVTLRYLEDRPVNEIAEILDCAPDTVRTHLRRGRVRLAALLDEPDSEAP